MILRLSKRYLVHATVSVCFMAWDAVHASAPSQEHEIKRTWGFETNVHYKKPVQDLREGIAAALPILPACLYPLIMSYIRVKGICKQKDAWESNFASGPIFCPDGTLGASHGSKGYLHCDVRAVSLLPSSRIKEIDQVSESYIIDREGMGKSGDKFTALLYLAHGSPGGAGDISGNFQESNVLYSQRDPLHMLPDGTVVLYNSSSRAIEIYARKQLTFPFNRPPPAWGPFFDESGTIALCQNKKHLVFIENRDAALCIWNLESFCRGRLPEPPLKKVKWNEDQSAWNPNQIALFTERDSFTMVVLESHDKNGELRIYYDMSVGVESSLTPYKILRKKALDYKGLSKLRLLKFAYDGSLLLEQSGSKSLNVWDVGQATLVGTIEATLGIPCFSISPFNEIAIRDYPVKSHPDASYLRHHIYVLELT